ncbi:hypothetical protein B0H13DRAFT_2357184 [Mycena leptocephala]|nr:hypothetical protein B0H13DRAFT_2357184 [Mycena leptocephala]
MFTAELFSGDKERPYQVDATGLASLTLAALASAFQVTPENAIVGLEGRPPLLTRLADAFSLGQTRAPGELVECLQTQSSSTPDGQTEVLMTALWHALITGLLPIWHPGRASLGGVPRRCAGVCSRRCLPRLLHKLTGWLAYSFRELLERVLAWRITHGAQEELQTGLPEYRNGGLFLDLDVLRLRTTHSPSPALGENDRTLTQMLESATWTDGRAIAAQLRPAQEGKEGKEGGGPPIENGTVF